MRLYIFLLVFLQGLAAGSSLAQSTEPAVEVSACELGKNPKVYHHRVVTVRATVNYAFEDFTLRTGNCGGPADISPTWVEFGGDLGSQTVYCCGDHSRLAASEFKLDGYAIPLERDSNLTRFLQLLKAHRDKAPAGGPCYDCFYFVVTATFTGRFFAGGWAAQKQGQAFPDVGYGHMGCCSMLVVERVDSVEAERTKISDASRFRCQKKLWTADSRHEDILVNADSALDRNDPNETGVYAMRRIAERWGFAVPDTDAHIYVDVSNPRWERAQGTWTSADKTVELSIDLKTRGEVDSSATGHARLEWAPQKIRVESCKAVPSQ